LERPEAEHVVEELAEQRLALAEAERRALLGQQLAEERANLALGARAIGERERLEVQTVEQLFVNARLQLQVLLARRLRARVRRWCGERGSGHKCLPDGDEALEPGQLAPGRLRHEPFGARIENLA